MGYFKELDLMIQERTEYNPETRENESNYLQFKDEIEMHISGQLEFDQLSPIAQDLMRDWENLIAESVRYHGISEESEDWRL